MKTALKQLNQIKKDALKPIYAIIGTERLLLEDITKALSDRINEQQKEEMNIIHYDLNESSIDDIIFEAESFPFFGEKKLIFVHSSYIFTGKKAPSHITHSVSLLENYLSDPSDFAVLVFIAPYEKLDKRKKVTKSLLKNAEVIDINPASEQETLNYLNSYCRQNGYQLSKESLERLLQLTDRKLTKAKNELDKLMIYHADDKMITEQSINTLVSKSLEQNIFELNDRVLKKNVKQSIELYHDLLHQKEDPIKILALMIGQFRLLLQVKILRKKGYQQADIASILKVHPYRVKLALQKEKLFKQEVLSKAHHFLIDADYEIKTGKVNPELQIELFIWKFSSMND